MVVYAFVLSYTTNISYYLIDIMIVIHVDMRHYKLLAIFRQAKENHK